MKKVCATLLALLVCVPVLADEAAFPSAPRDMKGAEAAKLERVTFDELKQLFPGTHDQKGFRGKLSTKDFLSGGKMKVSGAMQGTGTWRLDSKEGGIYCSEFGLGRGSRGPMEHCFAVFKAGDGVHYIDYDIKDHFMASVWRPAKK